MSVKVNLPSECEKTVSKDARQGAKTAVVSVLQSVMPSDVSLIVG